MNSFSLLKNSLSFLEIKLQGVLSYSHYYKVNFFLPFFQLFHAFTSVILRLSNSNIHAFNLLLPRNQSFIFIAKKIFTMAFPLSVFLFLSLENHSYAV